MLRFLKWTWVPGLLGACILTSVTGDIPILGALMEGVSTTLDVWLFENIKYPTAFLFFMGLFVAYGIYMLSAFWGAGRRHRALLKLGRLRTKGNALRIAVTGRPPVISDEDRAALDEMRREIAVTVGKVTPHKMTLFTDLVRFNRHDQILEVQPEQWGGHKDLLEFCEVLDRLQNFLANEN